MRSGDPGIISPNSESSLGPLKADAALLDTPPRSKRNAIKGYGFSCLKSRGEQFYKLHHSI